MGALEDTIGRLQRSQHLNEELGASAAQSFNVNPDHYAETVKTGKRLGVHPDVVGVRSDEVALQSTIQRLQGAAAEAPSTATFLADPENLKASHDDIENLSNMERVIRYGFVKQGPISTMAIASPNDTAIAQRAQSEFKKTGAVLADPEKRSDYFAGVGQRLKAGTMKGIGGLSTMIGENMAQPLRDLMGYEERSGFLTAGRSLTEKAKAIAEAAAAEHPVEPHSWLAAGSSALESIGQQVPMWLGAFLTKNPSAVLTGMGGMAAGQEYADLRQRGIAPRNAAVGAVGTGAVEVATEAWPTKILWDMMKPTAKRSFVRLGSKLVELYGAEIVGESGATFFEDVIDKVYTKPGMTAGEISAELAKYIESGEALSNFIDTVKSTAIQTTLMGGAGAGIRHTGNAVQSQFSQARAAKENAAAMESLGGIVKDSKTWKRLPEKVQDAIKGYIDHHGTVENVSVPVEYWQSALESQGLDPAKVAEDVLSDPSAYYEALATGSEVVIPLSEYATKIAPSEFHQSLMNDIRLRPGDMTAREAAEFENSADKEGLLKELETTAEDEDHPGENSARKVYDDVFGQLIGIRDRAAAEREATLAMTRARTRAERLSLDPWTLYQENPTQISGQLPNVLTNRPRVDLALDPILDRLRKGDIPGESAVNGPSLVEFLREKGIKDEGGELAAMDAGKERKAFQRRLVRKKGLTLDKAWEAAAEAGYLPMESSVADLLDGIRNDLVGKPIYAPQALNAKLADEALSLNQLQDNLHRSGIDLATMSNEDVRKVLEEQGALWQDPIKRGFFRQADGHVDIGLLEKADLSTFIHESGHQWLEELHQDAARPDAPQQVQDDWQTVKAWLGVEGDTVTVDQHEKFARSGEAYIMEGKAPSSELTSLFQRFTAWLTLIYKELRGLNVTLTDEVRGVFDRLLATDEEIANAEDAQGLAPIFATAEEAGMTAREFAAYLKTAQEAGEARRAALRNRLMKEVKREQKSWWKEEKAKVRAEVEDEVEQEPVYQAVQVLTKGKTFEGEEMPVKLDRAALVTKYGEEMLKRLPKGSATEYIYAVEGGVHPDVAAEMFGFSSGDELIQKIAETPKMGRYVAAETDRRMKERHGDLMGNIAARQEEAMKAVHNDQTGDVLRAELRAIRRKAREVSPFVKAAKEEAESALERERREREYERRWMDAGKDLAAKIERGAAQEEIQALRDQIKADKEAARQLRREGMANMRPSTEKSPTDIPPLETFKDAARQIIGNKPVKDIFPHVYQRAEAKAAKATETALAKQDFQTAAKEKQRQILNHFLYKEAIEAREEAEKILAYAKRLQSPQKQSKLGLAGEGYQEQINAILAKYEFAPVSLAELGRRAETLEKWIQRHEEETGIVPEIPEEVLTRALKMNYREMTMDELRAVNDALKNVDHLSKLANRIMDEDRVISMEAAKATLLDRVETSLPTALTLSRTDHDLTFIEGLSRKTKAVFDIFLRPETLIEWLDGGTSGPFHRMLWNRYRDAESRRQEMRRDGSADLLKVLEETSKESGYMKEPFFIPSLNRSLSRFSIIGVALNMGNESNLDKLKRGGEWRNGEHIEYTDAILDEMVGHLTEADWQMVKGLWDTVERLWPYIEKAEKERTGLVPPKIKPRTVVTPFGEIEGGYWPVVFDPRFSSQGIQQAADMAPKEIIGQIYRPAATKHGFTNERTNVARPMQLDWHRILSKHIDEVITHVSFWSFVFQTRRLLMDSQMRNVLQERLGETRFQSLEGWLRYSVRQDAIGDPTAAPLQKFMDGALTNTAVAALGFKVMTAWGNVAVAYFQAADRVNPLWQVRGVSEFFRSPKKVAEAIKEMSSYMKHREDNLDQSYVTVMNKLAGKDTVKARLARVAMSIHRTADFIGSFGIWQSAFRMATLRDGMTAQEAVRYADKVISTTQQAGAPGDLSAFERDPRFKALRMFLGPMIIMENRLADIAHYKGVKAVLSPEAWGQLLAYWFLPALVFEAAVGRGPDDDETWWAWATRKILTYPAQMFPIVRESSAYVEGKLTGHRSSFRMNPVYEAAKSMADFGAEAYRTATGDGDAEKLFKSGVRASGPAFGVPYQFEITGSYLTDLMTGEYTPENPYESVKYLFVRRPRK